MKNEIKRTGTARKVGRPRAYTPEALEAKFEEYVEWVKANPVYINKVSAGEIIPVPTQRPLTLVGFCQFAKISRQNFYEYESREEFSDILTACARLSRRTSWRAHYVDSTIRESLPGFCILPTVRM